MLKPDPLLVADPVSVVVVSVVPVSVVVVSGVVVSVAGVVSVEAGVSVGVVLVFPGVLVSPHAF